MRIVWVPLADEVLDQLDVAGLITPTEAAYLRGSLTRDEAAKANLSPDPAVRAARIIDVFLKREETFKAAIRVAVTAQSTRKQTSPKLMKELAAVLILRGLDLSPREAEQKRRCLVKAVPAGAERRGTTGVDWEATSRPCNQLMLEALDEVREAKSNGQEEPGPATVELAVRSILPLVANNALLAVRNLDGLQKPDSRQPWQVIDAMRQTISGVRQLGEVLREHTEGKKVFRAGATHRKSHQRNSVGIDSIVRLDVGDGFENISFSGVFIADALASEDVYDDGICRLNLVGTFCMLCHKMQISFR